MSDQTELELFAEATRGVFARHWPGAVAAELDDLTSLWPVAAEQGWFELGLGDNLDAVLAALGEAGAVACPLPLIDAFVAIRLLAEHPDLVKEIATGSVRLVVTPATDDSRPDSVDGAPGTTHALLLPPNGGAVLLRRISRLTPTTVLGQQLWSRLELGAVETTVPVSEALAREGTELLRLGLATRALGAATASHRAAVEHAKVRHQFGQPIGGFQAVQQRTASCEIEVTAGRVLIEEAVRLRAQGETRWMRAAELAVRHVLRAAPFVQFGAHHTLAASGYFEDHPAPWLFRRVHSDLARLSLFPPPDRDPADWLLAGEPLPDFDLGPEAEMLRRELTTLIEQRIGSRSRIPSLEGDDPAVVATLADAGLLGLAWPESCGGRAAGVPEQAVFSEVTGYHRLPIMNAVSCVDLVGHSLVRHGTLHQKATLLPMIARGAITMCLGYSEPETGSDLASLRTRADRDGDAWRINGQKLWSSAAHRATHVFLATRTDQDAVPRHAGITVFLVPMGTPGITVQEYRALSGDVSCAVYYDNVRAADDQVVGEVNGGWKVITGLLANERVMLGGRVADTLRSLDDMLALARTDPEGLAGPPGSARRQRLTDLAVRLQACRALVMEAVRATAAGGGMRLEAPMAKIAAAELAEDFGLATLEIFGPAAYLSDGEPGAIAGGAFEQGLRISVRDVVGGGTNDIQRGLIARALGLPAVRGGAA